MWKELMFVFCFVALAVSAGAQEKSRPWSFYIDGGVGFLQAAELKGINIPESGREYLNKRGIYSLNIETGDPKFVPNFNLGISYSLPKTFMAGRSRISLQLGNQNISQKNYHAAGFTTDLLFGFDFLRHPHHDFSLELGVGGYFTFNRMTYTWRGLDGEGKQIYIEGIPEQITMDMGWNNTAGISIPLRLSYVYNVGGSHWIGGYVQGRHIPNNGSFAPGHTASAGIEYRYTIGRKKQKFDRSAFERESRSRRTIIDTVYVHDTVYVNSTVRDTVYVNRYSEKESDIHILFEINDSSLSKYETMLLEKYDFSSVKSVDLTGCACSMGSVEYNERLARKRVDTVRDYLEKRGIKVNSTKVTVSSHFSPKFRSVEVRLNKN